MANLIPCPLCRAEPLLGGDNFGGRHIYCGTLGCSMPTAWGEDMGDAIAKWNARAQVDRSPEGQDNADWPDRNDESAVAESDAPKPFGNLSGDGR